jgi:ATP-dependent Lon protease
LGESSGEGESETQALRDAVGESGMPKDARAKAMDEIERLERMGTMSPEATVVRTYVETLVGLPWKKRTRDRLNLTRAETILDEDHYGLAKVKERILEYLAVVQLVKKPRGSILCLVGPPGVGKTSLGKSIARTLGRRFVRIALGGVRDEAEIRGHRRTYIGSMPGRIIQGLRRAGTKNPVFLMDEIDKLASDFRGDPSSALLEVLDPEQNNTFNDHYLDVDFDLSEVLFVTTANVLPAIPPPLRDRMEVLRLPGYLEHEKLGIAKNFLLPKQLKEHGLRATDLRLSASAWTMLITRYTREAGVRNLEREIAALCRKIARQRVGGDEKGVRLGPLQLERMLGPPRYAARRIAEEDQIGVSYGLAWTEVGGDILPIQVMVLPGRGKIALTGRLGEVMRESARTALSYARSRATSLGLSSDFADRIDLHLHMPEGAIPKDGPSAGISIATAVLSALTRIPVRRDVAMTGEITLLGNVLPIGGLKEKAVAASVAGFTRVLVPKANEPDWQDVSEEAKKRLRVTFVDHVDEVLRHALVEGPALERLLGASGPSEGLPGLAH